MSARAFFFAILPVPILAMATMAQQAPGTPTGGITLANQIPLSGRTAQVGSVQSQQSPVPGTTQSVNTLNATVSIQGPYGQSVVAGKPLEGKLSLREAVDRGIAYNLGAIGLNLQFRMMALSTIFGAYRRSPGSPPNLGGDPGLRWAG